MSQNKPSTTLDRLLDSIVAQLSPEAAGEIIELHAPDDVLARLDALAEKTTQGELTPEERNEYEGVIQIAHVITLIQARLAPPPPQVAAQPGSSPVKTPRTVKPSRNLSKLAGLQAMLDDLDLEPGRGS